MVETIAIIGSGHAGKALHEAFTRAKWPSDIAPRDAAGMRALVERSGIVALAVPHEARRDVIDTLGALLDGKILIDVTNPLAWPGPELALAGEASGAEELQRWAPRARVVKAFNTVFAPHMASAKVNGETMSMFAASDDAAARRTVLDLGRAIGYDAVDAGPLSNARSLERLLFFEMMMEKIHGSKIGWRFLHPSEER
jgi:predicted dinucleotide-binding enzyme